MVTINQPMSSNNLSDGGERPLPYGWVRQWDTNYRRHYYVDTCAMPPRSVWIHPDDERQGGPRLDQMHGGSGSGGGQQPYYAQSQQRTSASPGAYYERPMQPQKPSPPIVNPPFFGIFTGLLGGKRQRRPIRWNDGGDTSYNSNGADGSLFHSSGGGHHHHHHGGGGDSHHGGGGHHDSGGGHSSGGGDSGGGDSGGGGDGGGGGGD